MRGAWMNGKFAVNVERSLDPWTGPSGIANASLTIAILELSAERQVFEVLDLATGGVQLRYEGPAIAPMVRGPRPVGGV